MVEKLVLRENQKDHFRKIIEIIKNHHCYLDTSPQGSGKTALSFAIAGACRMPILVVTTKSIISNWENSAEKWNVELLGSVSYSLLSGRESHDDDGNLIDGCNHPYLERYGKDYMFTEYLMKLLARKVLVVFDEIANLRNPNSDRHRACFEIVKAVVTINNGSRVALLSNTPIEKKERLVSLIKLLGLTKEKNMVSYSPKDGYIQKGLNDLVRFCKRCGHSEKVDKILRSYDMINKNNASTITENIYLEIVKPLLVVSMKSSKSAIYPAKIYNGFFVLPEEDRQRVNIALGNLKESRNIIFGGKDHKKKLALKSSIAFTSAISVERGKLRTLVRLAREKLQADPRAQVALYLWYSYSIDYLVEHLKEFKPIVMDGRIKAEEREINRRLFQRDDEECRLLIANTVVAGTGIEIDDKHGNRKRWVYFIPNDRILETSQIKGRVSRGEETKSQAEVIAVYSLNPDGEDLDEVKLVTRLDEKSDAIRNSIADSDSIILPDQYETWIEEDADLSAISDLPIPEFRTDQQK